MSETANRLPESGRNILDPSRAYAAVPELELDEHGRLASTAVVFLTNKQCPFECVFCDLWVNTLEESVPVGAIPLQIRTALASLTRLAPQEIRHIKLYNAGSFFDPQAIPPDDDGEIAAAVAGFDRVIVEAHPAFLRGAYGERCVAFRDRVRPARLEVAIGLETAHPDVLAKLNKRMTLDDFRAAVAFLRSHDIDARAFILLQPPFMRPEESVEWACRSIDEAFDAGCGVCSIIPTRGVTPEPTSEMLEAVLEYGIGLGRGRVFADLWEVEQRMPGLAALSASEPRPTTTARLRAMNDTQRV